MVHWEGRTKSTAQGRQVMVLQAAGQAKVITNFGISSVTAKAMW
jgi:hypothetical protein